jgi:hypothetical protein
VVAIRQRLQKWDWRHWTGTVLAVLYLLYIALSYLYVPGKLKDVVQTDVAHLLGRDIQVQRIAFNPFTLSLTVDQFAIADRPDTPLVAWRRLYVNFNAWGSLFGWKIRFSTVELDAPRVAIERRKHDFNFSDILTRLAGDAQPQPKAKSALALQVDDIRILGGRFAFDDNSGAIPAHSSLDDVTVAVQKLYLATGDDRLNPITLQAVMPGGGQLRLTGNYRADPLKLDVNVVASDIHLETLKDFIANQVPLALNNGRLTLQTNIDVEMDKALQVQVRNGQIDITDLAVDDTTREPPLLRGRLLQLRGIEMNLAQRRFRIDGITLDGLNTDQWLDHDGRPRIQPLLARQETAVEAAPAAPKTEAQPWDFSVGRVTVRNTRVGFTDQRDGLNASQQIHDLIVSLQDVRLDQGAQIPLALSAKVNDTGRLEVKGRIAVAPFGLDLHYQLQALALSAINPYLEQLSWLHLRKGSLNADGDVKMHDADPLPLTLEMNAGVDDLQALDTRTGAAVLQWKGLGLDRLRLDLARRAVSIENVTLNSPVVALEVDANKQMNLSTLMKQAADTGPQATAADAAATEAADQPAAEHAWQVAVNQIKVLQGSARFRDASVKPVFKSGLYAVNFKLDRLSSAGDKPATFSLTSKVDKYAPFTVKGTLAPLQQQPGLAFTSELRGLEMPSLSPYTGTYIGRNLKSGRLALNLKYDVEKHRLQGENTIIAKQLYLGDDVPSEQAVNLPVALGLALLRDADGVIDLDVGVSGDLDDPGFSVSGIIWKALKNIIVKAASSPFQLLASLVGSSEDLGAIPFDAGVSELSLDGQEKLGQLVKALAQRPQLAVTVHGSAGATDDNAALQQQRVLEQIAARRKMPATELRWTALLDDKANRSALAGLNDGLKLPDEGKREEALKKADSQLSGDALTRQAYEQMLGDVAARQVISRQDLLDLADRRALAIKQYLVQSAGLDQDRVQLLKTRGEDLKGRVCELGVAPN